MDEQQLPVASEPRPQPGDHQRVSFVRLGGLVLGIAAIVFFAGQFLWTKVQESRAEASVTWFAPYVDVTLTPTLFFEDPAVQPASQVVLGFVVSDPTDGCTPSWGTYYSLDAAARALDLDRRIVRLRERGGDAIVSFGGASNTELAVSCQDTNKLVQGYQTVIDHYGLKTLDFDIEGATVSNSGANERRAVAIARLQANNPGLGVWVTLPVTPAGLTTEGVAVVDGLIQGGVDLTGVNIMTMDFGGSKAPGMSMSDATTSALLATWQQLDGSYKRAGITLTESQLWRHLGATPMIGQNDISDEVFSLSDAHRLIAYAADVDLGRLSFWSANRDVECGAVVDDSRVSNTCSGINQDPLQFSQTFAGSTRSAPLETAATKVDTDGIRVDALARDDPRSSPYPIWRSGKAYEESAKVVWQGRVYEAKWYTQNDQPDAPVKHLWETPWRYLGPVLESDRQAVRAHAAANGERVKWTAETTYVAGDEVEYHDQAFRAKWWTQGQVPEEDPDQPYDHPWEFLGDIVKETP